MYANGTCQRFLGHVCIHNSDSADRVYLRVETKAINGRFNEDGIDRDNVNERFGEIRSQSDRICRAAWLPPPPFKTFRQLRWTEIDFLRGCGKLRNKNGRRQLLGDK